MLKVLRKIKLKKNLTFAWVMNNIEGFAEKWFFDSIIDVDICIYSCISC